MLVTVSGMVGSGKSTAVAHIVALLRKEGLPNAEALNFRSLPCFGRSRDTERRGDPLSAAADSQPDAQRGRGYRRRRLTALLAVGYISRSVAFRLYRRRHRGAHVCNRYFFDSFSHFELESRGERMWLGLLRLSLPRPDLAILLVASPDTIARRRPNYSNGYLSQVQMAYARLPTLFPELEVLSTDEPGALYKLDALVKARINQHLNPGN